MGGMIGAHVCAPDRASDQAPVPVPTDKDA